MAHQINYFVKRYQLIEHTADIGIRVKAKSLKELFKQTALAMFDIIADQRPATRSQRLKKVNVKQEADNLEELLVNWLNELLSLSATRELIFNSFKIEKLTQNIIKAVVCGKAMKNYAVNKEIKAATYHELEVKKLKYGWQAKVIFDV